MVDHAFSDPALAALYDSLSPTDDRSDFGFYLPMIMSAGSVLDVGCGTGTLLQLARDAGHTGRLAGIDPGAGMLAQARHRTDIEWTLGSASDIDAEGEFDLIVMSGHAFQELVTDDELRTALTAIGTALSDGGRFAFEARDPAARAWESWVADGTYDAEVRDASGALVRVTLQVDPPAGDTVSFSHTYSSPDWERSRVSRSTLRFLDVDGLSSFLAGAGLEIEAQYGEWDRSPVGATSTEIITIARRRR
ncbi:class I SAM-dependent methyltransferase [Streptomyces sp. NPDC020965]|uniref:class I SAM-dependent methyltransferase n=1 Tax=Streptomyces sp. NPDC020965 TaxID=3365105 RepID=UPI0037A48F71